MKINEKIKQLRLLSGLSQADTAKKLFISQRAYCDIENGKTKLDIDRLEQIAKLYDIDVLDMIAKSKESNTQKIKRLEREIESLKNLLAK
ncbi:helix-turn-helix domain-containing protein [Epilithonimonas caeni]|uniref:helix-turn-helix domain-containing protein n=1 Tax=Epilithonimonas caeni TaxID=365343 RepID=UPI0004089C88|nr:helix-turn-helix transcriptional regulator [Epilithonimonas caeni]